MCWRTASSRSADRRASSRPMRVSSRLTWGFSLCHVVPDHLVDELAVTHSEAVDEADPGIGRAVEKLAVERAGAIDPGVECIEALVGLPRAAVAASRPFDERFQ